MLISYSTRINNGVIMQRTLFNTPVFKQFMQLVAAIFLLVTRFKIIGDAPRNRGYVLIAAPHTSNWDFPYMLAMAIKLDITIKWMGKASLFKGVWGPIMRFLGGISIDRSKKTNMVQQMVDYYREHPDTIVVIPPEGTRAYTKTWKSGFYHIANGANVDIGIGYLDFSKRIGGIKDTFTPTGSFEDDMPKIRAFYDGIKGAKPENFH